MSKYEPGVHTVSEYRPRKSGKWQPKVPKWAENDRLFSDIFALAEGVVDAVLRVLEGQRNYDCLPLHHVI